MNKYKLAIGQKVDISMYNPWIGHYQIEAAIIGFGNFFLNGIPTYNLRTINGQIVNNISENDIKIIIEA